MSSKTQDNPMKQQPTQRWSVQGYLVRFPARRFVPATDIIELADRLVILIELAGMRGDGFRIALDDQTLIVSGKRERPSELPKAAFHQVEIGFGEFRVEIPIPWTVKREEVSANYRNGFLRIDLPRQEPRRVQIVDVNADENKKGEE